VGCVYWIHLPTHTNLLTEGYIGVTSRSPSDRFAEHLSEAKRGNSNTLYKAIRKYGDEVVLTTLVSGSEDYCLETERRLRPKERIGWNVVQGGGKPPAHVKHSEQAKAKIAEGVRRSSNSPARQAAAKVRSGIKRSEDAKIKMREAAKDRLPWEVSKADKSLWARAAEIFQFWQANSHLGYTSLGKHFGLPNKYALQGMYRKFKQNWNPLIDHEWLGWIQTLTVKKDFKS